MEVVLLRVTVQREEMDGGWEQEYSCSELYVAVGAYLIIQQSQ